MSDESWKFFGYTDVSQSQVNKSADNVSINDSSVHKIKHNQGWIYIYNDDWCNFSRQFRDYQQIQHFVKCADHYLGQFPMKSSMTFGVNSYCAWP